ncbi:MAG: histidine--tRNA ligase [Magnetococcales bacterium]|nr:histidine--tRNA ligase [Magnetococcales bacterium]MBF0323059.1 histidine--tRNA ligase [Magnetococcales bacterium]
MITAVRGTRDFLPEETGVMQFLEQSAAQVFSCYGFQEIRTPLIEWSELFTRAVGETTDIVEKEMYTFPDRKGKSLSLRPEGTASVVRAFVNHAQNQRLPWRVWYHGPMFRYERPQEGRSRQFHQIGCEEFGAPGPLADAQMMAMAWRFLDKIGLGSFLRLEINTLGCPECRVPYRTKLEKFLQEKIAALCDNCRQRLVRNPLRVLDCKVAGCRDVARMAPPMNAHLCPACADHFVTLEGHLRALALPYALNTQMVRGLDYYTRTVFEVTTEHLGAQNAVAAGGRYDGLVESMGGRATPAIGFAMGMERLVALLEKQTGQVVSPMVFLVVVGSGEVVREGLCLAERLRGVGCRVEMSQEAGTMKSEMKRAGRSGAPVTLILGSDEAAQRQVVHKDMATGVQRTLLWEDAVQSILGHNGNGL